MQHKVHIRVIRREEVEQTGQLPLWVLLCPHAGAGSGAEAAAKTMGADTLPEDLAVLRASLLLHGH